MTLLVLGGTAWLGGVVATEAVRRGHQVVCLARGESGPFPDGVELVRGDRSTADGYAGLQGDFDALVDVTRDPRHVRTATDVLADRVGHWVFVSTCNVYADDPTPGRDESAPLLEPLPRTCRRPRRRTARARSRASSTCAAHSATTAYSSHGPA